MRKKIWANIWQLSLHCMVLFCYAFLAGGLTFVSWIGWAASTSVETLCRRFAMAIWLLPFISLAALSPSPSYGQQYSAQYDSHIQYAVDRFWTDFPYPWAWKAQLYAESRFNPKAVSPVGAKGLAQFMPGTWAQVTRDLGWGQVSPFSEKHSIMAGAYYMAKLRRNWHAKRTVWDRQWLAQASYNAGLGNILAAQTACGGRSKYDEIIRCLPKITGENSRETITYIERIAKFWSKMAPSAVGAYSSKL